MPSFTPLFSHEKVTLLHSHTFTIMQQQSDKWKWKLSLCALLEVITGIEKHKGLNRNKKTPLTASMDNYKPPSKPGHIDLLAGVKQVKNPSVQSMREFDGQR